jgi:hypothetical protein
VVPDYSISLHCQDIFATLCHKFTSHFHIPFANNAKDMVDENGGKFGAIGLDYCRKLRASISD